MCCKKILLILSLLFIQVFPVNAQEFTYFNKKISFDEANKIAAATIPHEGGYYTVGVVGYSHSVIYFANIDLEGNILDYHILDDSPEVTTIVNGRRFIQTLDGNFVLVHSKWVTDSDVDVFLLKFTKEGQVLWEEQFGLEGIDGTGEVINTEEGGFLIAGFASTANHSEMYVVKTDSRGVLEWEKTYCFNRSCIALSVDITSDGGYILGGQGKVEDNNSDMYIVKIDSLGNKKWEKNYGEDRSDCGCIIKTLNDGNYLLSSCIRQNNTLKNYYAKLDQGGEIIWDRTYYQPDLRGIQTPITVREDGGFIGAAFQMKDNIPTPIILNFDANAKLIWKKTITPAPTSHVYIKDIDKIEGGYVLTGYKFAPTPQYGWMVTIDEDGNFCEELGCVETVVDIEDTEAEGQRDFLNISPNPVRGQAVIHYQIPLGKKGVLKVYDYQGKEIGDWILNIGLGELILEVEDWSGGVYLYGLEVEGERVESGKLVVEK